jgi:hypothetical protein
MWKGGREGGREGRSAYLNIAIREPGGGDEGSVSNAHPVVDLQEGREGGREGGREESREWSVLKE